MPVLTRHADELDALLRRVVVPAATAGEPGRPTAGGKRTADMDVKAWNAANPDKLKDATGKWAEVPGVAADISKLKGAGRIDLEPGERLLKSDRVKGDSGRAWFAATEKGGRRSLRIGLGNVNFGTRHDARGPWRAGPDRTAEINEERAELRALMDDLEQEIEDIEDDPDADPARLAELRAQLEGYEEAGADSDVVELPDGYTAVLDERGAQQLRETLAKALNDGEKLQAELEKPYQELDRLTLERDKLKRKAFGRKFTTEEDAEWDRLTAEIARAEAEFDPNSRPERPDSGYWTLAEGSIPGQWADIYYDIYLDDPSVGVEVHLGAVPHGSEMDFEDMRDAVMTAWFATAEADEFLRLLAKMDTDTNVSRSQRQTPRATGRRWTRSAAPDVKAAGLAVVAADTGRVLMLQRALDDTDPASGRWEFPGGGLENDEEPLDAAKREWSEETGCDLPDGELIGQWHNGVYCGYVWRIGSEDDVEVFGDRDDVANPDDPDGDAVEALAWWPLDQLTGSNPALRDELRQSLAKVNAALTGEGMKNRAGIGLTRRYNPMQPRDDDGRWSKVGALKSALNDLTGEDNVSDENGGRIVFADRDDAEPNRFAVWDRQENQPLMFDVSIGFGQNDDEESVNLEASSFELRQLNSELAMLLLRADPPPIEVDDPRSQALHAALLADRHLGIAARFEENGGSLEISEGSEPGKFSVEVGAGDDEDPVVFELSVAELRQLQAQLALTLIADRERVDAMYSQRASGRRLVRAGLDVAGWNVKNPRNPKDADGKWTETPGGAARVGKKIADWFRSPTYRRLSTGGHIALDVIGLAPGWGEPVDLVNAAWYLAERKPKDAFLSLGSTIPGLGYISSTVKAIKHINTARKFIKVKKAVAAAKKTAKATEAATDLAGAAKTVTRSGAPNSRQEAFGIPLKPGAEARLLTQMRERWGTDPRPWAVLNAHLTELVGRERADETTAAWFVAANGEDGVESAGSLSHLRMAGKLDDEGNLHSLTDGRFISKTGGIAAADKLKLGGRAPAGFSVLASKKLKTDYADVAVAEIDGPDGPQFRIGVIGNESGKWDAGFVGESRRAELRKQVAEKRALFESESDDVDDDIEDQISELESELEDLEGERTAVVSPEQMTDFRRQLDEALIVAKANKAEQDEAVKKYEALDKKRDAIIDEHSDAELERQVWKVSYNLRQAQKIVRSLEYDLKNGSRHGWSPERVAERLASWKADVAEAEAELAPLLARRAEIVPPDVLTRLEDLDRQQAELNDADIDDMLTAAEVSASNGTRIRAEVWGSDDIDEQWVSSRLYVLAPGETTQDAEDDHGSFRGLRGLNKLISGLAPADQSSEKAETRAAQNAHSRGAVLLAAAIVDELLGAAYTPEQLRLRAGWLRFDADQPRIPAGHPDAGQWMDVGLGRMLDEWDSHGTTLVVDDFDNDGRHLTVMSNNTIVVSEETYRRPGDPPADRVVLGELEADSGREVSLLIARTRGKAESFEPEDGDDDEIPDDREVRLIDYDTAADGQVLVGWNPDGDVVIGWAKNGVDEPDPDEFTRDYEYWPLDVDDAASFENALDDAIDRLGDASQDDVEVYNAGSYDLIRFADHSFGVDDGGEDGPGFAASHLTMQDLLGELMKLRDFGSVAPQPAWKTYDLAEDEGFVTVGSRRGDGEFTFAADRLAEMIEGIETGLKDAQWEGRGRYMPPEGSQRTRSSDHWQGQPRDPGGEGGGRWVAGPISLAELVEKFGAITKETDFVDGSYRLSAHDSGTVVFADGGRSGNVRHPAKPPHRQESHGNWSPKVKKAKAAEELAGLKKSVAGAKAKASGKAVDRLRDQFRALDASLPSPDDASWADWVPPPGSAKWRKLPKDKRAQAQTVVEIGNDLDREVGDIGRYRNYMKLIQAEIGSGKHSRNTVARLEQERNVARMGIRIADETVDELAAKLDWFGHDFDPDVPVAPETWDYVEKHRPAWAGELG